MTPNIVARVRRPQRFRVTPFRVITFALIAIVAVLIGYPFVRVVFGLFVHDGTVSIAPLREAFSAAGVGGLIRNSIFVVACAGVLALVFGAFLAWLNERTDARIRGLTDFVPLMPFLLPSIAFAIGWTLLLSPGAGMLNVALRGVLGWFGVDLERGPLNIFTMYGLIFCYFVVLVPYVFLFVSAGLRNLPGDLEEQARISGAGPFKVFRKVTLPALKPSLAAAGVLVVWFGLAMFSIPLIIGTGANIDVLTVRIVRLINFTYPPRTDVAVSLSLVILLIVGGSWLLQMRIMSKSMFAQVGGGRAVRSSMVRLGRWKWPARAVIIGFLLVSGVLPVVGLLLTALNGYWSENLTWSSFGFAAFKRVFDDPLNVAAFGNSLLLGLVAGTGIILFAALMATYFRRQSGVISRFLESTIRLPVVVSGFVLIVGMILAYSGAPFHLQGTFVLFVIAYMATSIPQASIVADSSAAQISKEMTEAGAVAGAADGRVFTRIQLPLMAPGLVAGWTLVFVHITGDMEVASMLSSSQNPVVGFRILSTYDVGRFAELAAMALTLTVITMVCVAIGTSLGRLLEGGSRKSHRTSNRSLT